MNNLTPKVPTRIRTFAADIEAVRGIQQKEQAAPTPTPKEVKKAEPTYAGSPQPINHPQPVKVVEKKKLVTNIFVPPEKNEENVEQTKPILNKIPSFHEISNQHKNYSTISVSKEPNIKVSTGQKGGTRHKPNVGYDSTIITDTKSDRFKLFPSIVDSLRTWFKLITKKRKRSAPKYVIPETERRKGVIQKATSKSGTIFTADNETLKEQIRRRQQETSLYEKDEPETIWSPYTEAGYELLEAPEDEPTDLIQNIQVIYKKVPPIAPAEPAKSVETYSNPTPPEPISFTKSIPTETGNTATIELDELRWNAKPENRVGKAGGIREYVPRNSDPAPTTTNEEFFADEIPEPEERAVPPTAEGERIHPGILHGGATSQITKYKTNTLTIVLLGSVIGLVLLIVTGRIAFQYIQTITSQEVTITKSTAPISRSNNFEEIILRASDTSNFTEILISAISATSSSNTEFSVVSPVQDEISPSYIFDLLGFRTAPTLKQSLTSLRFIALDQNHPAILLQFVDRDTVRGGFLAWEETMIADFRNLYNIPINGNQRFTDDTINTTDVRVVTQEEDSVLVYGFIGDRTILITRTTEQFAQISSIGLR